jgi:ATP-dependent RNA helicase DeaD
VDKAEDQAEDTSVDKTEDKATDSVEETEVDKIDKMEDEIVVEAELKETKEKVSKEKAPKEVKAKVKTEEKSNSEDHKETPKTDKEHKEDKEAIEVLAEVEKKEVEKKGSGFNDLGLSNNVLKSITALGYETPTEIQSKAIPILLNDPKDFIGLAQTGTGKTAAFGLPLIEYIDTSNKSTQALIIAPTRELGQQIAAEIQKFIKYSDKVESQVVYGGASISDQIRLAKKKTPHIIIGTPGRLCDLLRRGAIKLDKLKYFVLDEADEMLNMGFKDEIDDIFEFIQGKVHTWLFSATMPKEIRSIVKNYMVSDYNEVAIKSDNKVNKNITHQYVIIRVSEKLEVLRRVLDFHPGMRSIIFCRTKADTQKVADELMKEGYRVEPLHGDLSQAKRNSVLKKFREASLEIVIATDVAARGIDVDDLTHVIHYRLPDSLETYTHRSGRTARAGKSGISLSFVTKGEVRRVNDLERKLKIKFEKATIPTLDSIREQRLLNWSERLLETPVAKLDEQLISKINLKLVDLDKEELVGRLMKIELDKMASADARNDLNVPDSGRDERERGGKEGHTRLSINLGRIDHMSVPDFLEMMDSVAGVQGRSIGDIKINDKNTIFETPDELVKQIKESFEGLEYEGRAITLKEDRGSSFKSSRRRDGGGGNRFKSGNRGGRDRSRGRGDRDRRKGNDRRRR